MAITTRMAPAYGGQQLLGAVICLVLSLWGAYDYYVKIPNQEATFARFEQADARMKALEIQIAANPALATQETKLEYVATKSEVDALSPGGKAPTKPNKFNRAIQWVYIAGFPFTFVYLWLFVRTKRQVYRLDDDGTLHFAGDPQHKRGAWSKSEITDIDMSRWMAKSIATVVRSDGARLQLDAHRHKQLEFIIGEIASGFYPDQWDKEGRRVKMSLRLNENEADAARGAGEPVIESADSTP